MMQNREFETIYFDKIKNGDISYFEKVYKDLHPRLFAFCKKFIYDNQEIKDLLQDVFLYIWNNREQVEIATTANGYIFSMVQNRCLNYIRQLKIKNKYLDNVETNLREKELNFFGNEPNRYTSIFFKDIERIYYEALQDLPEKCKEIFLLSRKDGLTNLAIAEKLNISIRTVENQIYKALKLLKEHLKDYLPAIFFLEYFMLK